MVCQFGAVGALGVFVVRAVAKAYQTESDSVMETYLVPEYTLRRKGVLHKSVQVIFTEDSNISEFQNHSLLKRGQVQNLSCGNVFFLYDNKKHIFTRKVLLLASL